MKNMNVDNRKKEERKKDGEKAQNGGRINIKREEPDNRKDNWNGDVERGKETENLNKDNCGGRKDWENDKGSSSIG